MIMKRSDPSLAIRPARPVDAAALTDLSMRSKASNGYDAAFMAACREELTVTPERMAEGQYWLVEIEGAIRGCVCLGIDEEGSSGEITACFIDPECQRRGIGRRLWERVLAEARAAGLVRLHLAADPAAVPFYERIGFVTIGEVPSGSIARRSLPHMTRVVG